MATKVEKSSSSDNAPLYDMVLNLVQHHLTFKNYTIDDKVSSLSESQKLDVKVNKIMKILIDSDSQDACSDKLKVQSKQQLENSLESSSRGLRLQDIGLQDYEREQNKLMKRLFQQDIEPPSDGSNQNNPIKSQFHQPDSIVLKVEEQRNVITKFQELFNLALEGRRITRSQMSKIKGIENQTSNRSERQTPELELVPSEENERQEKEFIFEPKKMTTAQRIKKKFIKSRKINKNAQKSFFTIARKKSYKKRCEMKDENQKQRRTIFDSQERSTHGRKPANPHMEKKLICWIMKVLEHGLKLTQTEIRKKARRMMSKYYGDQRFAASKGWMQKFFRRHKAVSYLISERNKSFLNGVTSSDQSNSIKDEKESLDINIKDGDVVLEKGKDRVVRKRSSCSVISSKDKENKA